MGKKYRCCKYLRLSKEDTRKLGTDESMSIESQRMIIESFCKYHNLDLVREYVDDGFSGGNFDRPGFKKMIEDIESGIVNCVITKDLSRLGRELYRTGIFIEEYFNEKDIRYIAINDGYDSVNSTDNSLSMRLTFNDYYIRDISKKVKSSLVAKQKRGDYIGSFPKYGFKKDPHNHNHLIIDPVASLIVKRIYNLTLNGLSPYEIADILTKEKIPIPVVYKKDPRGFSITENEGFGIWRPQTIRDILRSEMYIGNMVQHTFEKMRYSSKKLRLVDKEERYVVLNTHDAIIDKKTFDKVQVVLEANSKMKGRKKNKDRFLFSGLLVCHECGHKISILEKKNKKNNSHYTQCSYYSKKGKYGICNSHRINYNLLEEDLINIIKDVSMSFLREYDNNLLVNEANQVLSEEINDVSSALKSIMFDIKKYNNAIEKLYMDNVEGRVSDTILNNLLSKYNDELSIATKKKEDLEHKKNELEVQIQSLDYNTCSEVLQKFLLSGVVSRGFIIELVEKVEIDNDKNIKIFFR